MRRRCIRESCSLDFLVVIKAISKTVVTVAFFLT